MIIAAIHGPNLNLLGEREPAIYGTRTLAELNGVLERYGRERGVEIETMQSNHEGAIIDRLHDARTRCAGVVINPGAYGHTSYAIRDAIDAIRIPVVEVHLSNVETREPFRRLSTIADVCIAKISGRGAQSYTDAIDRIIAHLATRAK